jgi:nucleoside-triphosphatase THEP1
MYSICSLIDLDGAHIGGMIQVPHLPNSAKEQYQLSDQYTGEVRPILDRQAHDQWSVFKDFYVNQKAFEWANDQIVKTFQQSDYLIFDEIGMLEIAKMGFYPSFTAALRKFTGRIIFNVRDKFLTQICEEFELDNNELIIIDSSTDSDAAYERIMNE